MSIITPQVTQVPSPNHSLREGTKIQAVVVHIMEGSIAACDSWFQNPSAQVSAHYGVGKHGQIHQYVQDSDAAWANGELTPSPASPTPLIAQNGNIDPNRWTLSIEHEGTPPDTPQAVQLDASVSLCAWLCQQHGIPADAEHIIRHSDIGGHLYCPGWSQAFYEQYVAAVAARLNGGTVAQPTQQEMQAALAKANIYIETKGGVNQGVTVADTGQAIVFTVRK